MIFVSLCILGVELAGIAAQLGVTTCTFATQANCPNFLPNSYCNLATGKCECPTAAGYFDDGTGVTCIYQCGDLAAPANGAVDTSGGTTTGDIATLSCNNGYKMNGLSTSWCKQDEGWDNTATTCVPGELGDDCSADLLLCLNIPFGTCDFTSCVCQAGYENDGTDTVCSEIDECAPGPCQNGANCTDAFSSYRCTCVPGYEGTHCETNIDECATNPCLNGATCVDGINDYKCNCVAGYDGGDCQNNIDDCQTNLCLNGASCVDEINNYTCNCVAGFNGGNCENNINECASNPCQNAATCVDGINDYKCNCVAGYGGSHCEISHTWIIVGGIIACFAIVLILNNVVCFIWIRRKINDNNKDPATHVNPIYIRDNAEPDGYEELQIPKR